MFIQDLIQHDVSAVVWSVLLLPPLLLLSGCMPSTNRSVISQTRRYLRDVSRCVARPTDSSERSARRADARRSESPRLLVYLHHYSLPMTITATKNDVVVTVLTTHRPAPFFPAEPAIGVTVSHYYRWRHVAAQSANPPLLLLPLLIREQRHSWIRNEYTRRLPAGLSDNVCAYKQKPADKKEPPVWRFYR